MPDGTATEAIQTWMQAAILAGGTGAADIRERVHGDNRLSPEARLSIYAQAYRLRLLETLRAEYPLLAALAGPTAFDLFAGSYIAATPSRSFTLYDVGAGFADHLAASQPVGDPQAVGAIPATLARIERTMAEVARAEGTERGVPDATPAATGPVLVTLLGLHVGHRYRRPDSVRLLALPFDFTRLLAAAPGAPLPLPDPSPSWLAVARKAYHVRCHRLDEVAYHWLAALPGPGEDIADHAIAARPDIAAWLPQAEACGLAVAV